MSAAFDLKILHQGWNTFGIATLRLADGRAVERALEHHGEAVCVLPYDPVGRTALLVRQARVGPMFWGERGEIDEAPAGGLDDDDPAAAAIREAFEETGVALRTLEPIGRIYSMPSVSSERLHLYLAPYAASDLTGTGGGLHEEGERIEVRHVALAALRERVEAGELTDLKTLALVQALMLRRPHLFAAARST